MHIHSNIPRGPQPSSAQETIARDPRIEAMEKEFFSDAITLRKRAVGKIESAENPSLLEKATKLQQKAINILAGYPCPPNCTIS